MCEWIKENVGDDVPLHLSRFHPAYNLRNLPPTPVDTLYDSHEIADKAGLKYVYIGNIPDNPRESTYCDRCGKMLIKRVGYSVIENNIESGACPYCGNKIPGIWRQEKNAPH